MSLKITSSDLTPNDYRMLKIVEHGVNVFGTVDAVYIRDMDRRLPKLVKICAPKRWYGHGNPKLPHFGVRCTPKGRALLRDYEADHLKVSQAS